jgi:hypothetical protein
MDDNTVVKTENATRYWREARDWNGSNHIGRSSRSQWHDQTLYRSRKGRYYVEFCTRVEGEMDRVDWVSNREATRWLILNECELPDDLKELEDEVTE